MACFSPNPSHAISQTITICNDEQAISSPLQETLPSTSYDYIVDQQPIAAKLFRQFCARHKGPFLYDVLAKDIPKSDMLFVA